MAENTGYPEKEHLNHKQTRFKIWHRIEVSVKDGFKVKKQVSNLIGAQGSQVWVRLENKKDCITELRMH